MDVLHARAPSNPCEIRRFICQQRPAHTERKPGRRLINSPLTFANRLQIDFPSRGYRVVPPNCCLSIPWFGFFDRQRPTNGANLDLGLSL